VFLLVGTFIADVVVVAMLCGLPFLVRGRRRETVRPRGVATALAYFGCLGAGFMMIELSLMQRFILFLGHPTYALTVVVFVLLLGGGIGPVVERMPVAMWHGGGQRGLQRWSSRRELCVHPAQAVLGRDRPAPANADRARRRCVMPLGLLLGVCFPCGVRALGGLAEAVLPWAWAVNRMSVLGSALAMLVAMNLGFVPASLPSRPLGSSCVPYRCATEDVSTSVSRLGWRGDRGDRRAGEPAKLGFGRAGMLRLDRWPRRGSHPQCIANEQEEGRQYQLKLVQARRRATFG
jgi:hypothetical protein